MPNRETQFSCLVSWRVLSKLAVTSNAIHAMYAQSLAWLTVLAAIICGVANITSLVLIDFVHGNPHRTLENAIVMIVLFTPVFGVIAAVGTVIVFALPQCFQALVSGALVRRFGDKAQLAILLVLPMTAVITWYSYDYLTPSDLNLGINVGPDWRPYQHGLTAARYLSTLVCQTPATLFSIAYVGTARTGLPRNAVVLLALAAAVLAGGFAGHRLAEGQYPFL